MPPWTLLDFPVLVPAAELGQPWRVHSCGYGRCSVHPEDVFEVVAIAVGGDDAGVPDWIAATQPRRGIRPYDEGDDASPLTEDSDLRTAAASAVSGLLEMTMRQDLPVEEVAELVQHHEEQSRALAAALQPHPRPEGPWRREVVRVDGAAFALWVHRSDRGWAAAADLGPVTVSLHGTVPPGRWELSALPAAQAAVAFGDQPTLSVRDRGDAGGQGWFGPHLR